MELKVKKDVKEVYQEWSAAKSHKATVTQQMKDHVAAVAEILEIDKKKASKLFSLMESDSSTEDYNILSLFEEVVKK